jgi:hypothetical protein
MVPEEHASGPNWSAAAPDSQFITFAVLPAEHPSAALLPFEMHSPPIADEPLLHIPWLDKADNVRILGI